LAILVAVFSFLVLIGVPAGLSLGAALISFFCVWIILDWVVLKPLLAELNLPDNKPLTLESLMEHGGQLGDAVEDLRRRNDQLGTTVPALEREVAALKARLQKVDVSDALTGLNGGVFFRKRLDEELERAQRHQRPFSLVGIDVDYFMNYNDEHGEGQANELLQRLAALLAINLRTTDLLARIKGDSFAVILFDTELTEARNTAERLCRAVAAQPFPGEESQPEELLTASVALVGFPQHGQSTEELIRRMDSSLLDAKGQGRNCVVIADG
jgi:diguanylate cyclase (GGDEF)-like protein